MRPLALALLVAVSGCSSVPTPPYRDFRPAALMDRPAAAALLREAALEAGWALAASPDSAVVSTQPRPVNQGVLSTTTAALDLVPLGRGFVRVFVRAERRSFWGSRGKVYGLDAALRRDVLGPISRALEARGLTPLEAPRERDEEATD